MNERTGRNRRWIQSRNPSLEALEARLVLAEAATLGWQHLLAPAEQHGRLAPAGVTIDSAAGIVKPKADLPFISPKDLGGIAEPPTRSPHYLSQGSLTEPPAAIAPQPISLGIEVSVAGLPPSSASEVASVIKALFSGVDQGAGHKSTPPPAKPNAPPPLLNTPNPTNSDTGQSTGPTPPLEPPAAPERAAGPERGAAPESPNTNVELAQAVAGTETVHGTTPNAPPQSPEALSKQGTSPLAGQDPSIAVGSVRMIDGYTVQERIYSSQGIPAADFASLPLEQAQEGRLLSPILRLALRAEEDGESPPAPQSGDLILDFLPYNVTALRTTLEGLLAQSEQVLLNGVRREGLAVGLITAALVASGMAGYAAWERTRGPEGRPGSLDWLEGGAITRHNLTLGLQFPELT